MNKNFVPLILLPVLALSLISCSGETSTSLHSEITVEISGEHQNIPVTLYEGEGYSIYIPDEGWNMNAQSDEGDYLVNAENEQVFLNIVESSEQTPEDARKDILFHHEGFTFGEMDAKSHFSGIDSFTGQMVDVWLLETQRGTLIVWAESATEGFNSYLTAIADTIQITD